MIENEPAANSTTPLAVELAAFDELPSRIRKFLRECPFNYDAANVLHWYREAYKVHGPWAEQIILDWKARAVQEQRVIEIREGRLVPQSVRRHGQTTTLH